jgi:spore coat-associated protein N
MTRIMSTRAKLLASTALLAAAAGAAGLGTFGSFTGTTSASEAVTAGTVVVGLTAPGAGSSLLSVPAAGIVPGDTIQRVVTLNNTGSENFSAVTVTTAAAPTSILDTDITNGLQVQIQSCTTAWTAAYTCAGSPATVKSVVGNGPIIGLNRPMNNLSALTAGASDNLLVTMTLPSTAGDTFQGKTSTVTFTFNAAQRAVTTK